MGRRTGIESFFSPRRLFLLLKRDFVHGYRGVLIAMAAVGGLMLLISLVSMLGRPGGDFYTPFYVGLLVLGGLISTSAAFREVHQPASGPFYLTLPGSLVEKLVSKLLVSSVGFAAATLVFVGGVSALSELINRAIFGAGHRWFNPVAIENLHNAAIYLVFQSIYLLGSIWFRKVAFLKTVLAQSIIGIGIFIIAMVILRIVLGNLFTHSGLPPGPAMGQMFSRNFGQFSINGQSSPALAHGIQVFGTVARVCFWALLAPFCWVAAYFRLRETEV
jgi:hypothetical protein